MLLRTHISFTIFVLFLLELFFEVSTLFFFVSIFSTLIPDIDSRFSRIGRKKSSRFLQFFFSHRGFLHSAFFLILIFGIFYLFALKSIAQGFLLGYGFHIFLDSLTKGGIALFYPFKFRVRGFLKTGGIFEKSLFYALILIDCVFFAFFVSGSM